MENVKITTPILLVGFNRADDILQSFNSIKAVKPTKLYVSIDGPRPSKVGEDLKVQEVIDVVKKVDWECEVQYRFLKDNLGCKGNMTSAISWVFEREDRVIVIEDDIVAPYSFFLFQQQMLEKYKDDKRIGLVSGNNYTPRQNNKADYIFSMYAGHIWGWGTWKRVWDNFDLDLPGINDNVKNNLFQMKDTFNNWRELYYYRREYKNLGYCITLGKDNFWALHFAYYRHLNKLLNIVPRVNLASNIGICSSRVNANSDVNKNYYAFNPDFRVIKHSNVERDKDYDYYHLVNHLDKMSFRSRIKMHIRNLIREIQVKKYELCKK